jgi:hypothetical protein
MAIQFTDFTRAPVQESPLKNIFEDAFKGYSLSQIPGKLADEKKQRELANQLKSLEVEHKPKEYALTDQGKSLANALHSKALEHYEEKFGLERDLKKAQIDKAKRAGMAAGLSPSGDVKNAEFIYQLKQSGADPKHIEILEKAFNAGMKHTEAITNRSVDMTAGGAFDKLPVNDKKREIGLMTAMGVDPVEAASILRKGTSASQYAKDKGIDISQVTPQYALGEQNIKDIQRTSAYFDELGGLEKNITEGLGEYQNKIGGYSLEQIADQLAGDNPEKVGKALAARALLPELSALRLKVQGGNIGIEAIRELENKSLGHMKVVESLVDKPTFLAMQRYMNQWLQEAGSKRIKALEGYGKLKGALNKGSGGDKVFDLATGGFE